MRDVQIFKLESAETGSLKEILAKKLLAEVAAERNWPADEIIYGYSSTSASWIVLDGYEVIGAAKLVFGDPKEFPIRKSTAWPRLSILDFPVAEAALLGVKRDARGRGVFAALCSAIYWYLIDHNIPYVEAILDKRNLRMHREWGMRFQALMEDQGGGAKDYWGDPDVFPARLYVGSLRAEDAQSMGNLMIRNQPDIWSVFMQYRPARIKGKKRLVRRSVTI